MIDRSLIKLDKFIRKDLTLIDCTQVIEENWINLDFG